MTVSIHKMTRDFFVDSVKSDMWDMPPLLLIQPKGEKQMAVCVLSGISPVDFLQGVVNGEYRETLPEFPDGVSGLAVHSEGWALKAATPQDVEWTRNHSIADHPKGHEVKTLISYNGRTTKSLTLFRGDEEPIEEEDGKRGVLQGRIPSLLSAAFEGLNKR